MRMEDVQLSLRQQGRVIVITCEAEPGSQTAPGSRLLGGAGRAQAGTRLARPLPLFAHELLLPGR